MDIAADEPTAEEENIANGHEEAQPNAFDKVQADENDEGKTALKVS